MNRAKIVVLPIILIIAIVGLYIAVFGISEKTDFNKPIRVLWSRDVCAQCGMSIVDRFHAAEIVNPKTKEVYKFDDIGDAVVWAKKNRTADWLSKSIIWVTDSKTGKWLNARKAYYVKGQTTPMGYGLGALAKPIPGAVTWKDAVPYLLKKRKSLLAGKMKMKNMKGNQKMKGKGAKR